MLSLLLLVMAERIAERAVAQVFLDWMRASDPKGQPDDVWKDVLKVHEHSCARPPLHASRVA